MNGRPLVLLVAAVVLSVSGAGCSPMAISSAPGTDAAPAMIPLATDKPSVVQGSIDRADEVDRYSLGFLRRGTHLRVEVQATSGTLDPMVGVFNDQQFLWALNDDVDFRAGLLDSLIEGPIFDDDNYVVAVASTTAGAPTFGGYRLKVRITEGTPVDPPGQTVFLDFDGAIVRDFPDLPDQMIRTFDATQLGFSNAMTPLIINRIVELMERDYQGLNVTFVTSASGTPTGAFTRVVFGGGSAGLFGISDEIDPFNTDLNNTVLIFTENFRGLSQDPEEVAQAIANVASHELGHALGLWHVDNDSLLMDAVTPDSRLIQDQHFGRGPLADFPIGSQDAMALLQDWLGLQ